MRQTLAGRPDDLALLDAMEAEHAAVDPLVETIDAALADRASGPERVADLTDALAGALRGHLKHEEDEGLPLIDAVVTPEQWLHFGAVHGSRTGPDAPQVVPWLLDGADEQAVATALATLPEPLRVAYRDQWRPPMRPWTYGTPPPESRARRLRRPVAGPVSQAQALWARPAHPA